MSGPRESRWSHLKKAFGFDFDPEAEQDDGVTQTDAVEERQPVLIEDDGPIVSAAQDRFGVDAFAGIVATALLGQGNAEGTVVALNGPWGAGKSSAVNLVVAHLARLAGDSVEVIRFNPWWFSGSDDLARAFLGEVAGKIGRAITDDGKDALKGIVGRLTKLDTYIEAGRKAGDDGIGSGLASLLFEQRSVEDDHRRLSGALRQSRRRFVVVIDDLDRLDPDEALQMFQLVKSVGRLPGVAYLLAFDRLLIERMLKHRYPSEGGQYLEKVLQATFDLPDPSPAVLRAMTLEMIEQLVDVTEEHTVRFMNLFEDVVVPRLTTPRQVVRYLSSLRVSWPAVAAEVDPGDFMAIEAIRVFEPALYRAVRQNGPLVRGEDKGSGEEQWSALADRKILEAVEKDWRDWAKTSLMRLFPQLQGAWANTHFGGDFHAGWDADRLVCTQAHFPTYFSYSVPTETLSGAERRALIEAAADPSALRALLLEGLGKPRGDGGTRAALMLDALNTMGKRLPIESVPTMLEGVFGVADDLAVAADERKGFGLANNKYRVHWLLNAQVRERIPFDERAPMLERALAAAQVGIRVDFADRLAHDYDPPKEGERSRSEPLIDEENARRLQAEAVEMMLAAARDGTLLDSNRAINLLWRLTHEKEGEQLARGLTARLMDRDEGVVRLAEMMTTTSWSQGMGLVGLGDRVARGSPRVQRDGLERIVDAEKLHARAATLVASENLTDADRAKLRWFLRGWDLQDDD